MQDRRFDYATRAFAFIETLDSLDTVPDLSDAMEQSFAWFGFETFIITGLPDPRQRFEQLVLLRKWPLGWFELYAKNNFVRVDPVIRMCRSSVHSFAWCEAPYDAARETQAAEVMHRAADFRMTAGFCLPIHGLHGYEACLSLGGINLDLSFQTRPAIHLMALYAFERVRQVLAPQALVGSDLLTPREREALTWAAAGKSACETGEILGITERTVTAHIVSACQKLGAANKTQAVVRAIQHRLIAL